MKVLMNASATTLLLALTLNVDGFTTPSNFVRPNMAQKMMNDDAALFDSLLSEGGNQFAQNKQQNTRSRIVLPESSSAPGEVMMTSSLVAPTMPTYDSDDMMAEEMEAATAEDDFLSEGQTSELAPAPSQAVPRYQPPAVKRKIFGIRFTDSGETLSSRLENKDYAGIITSYIVPITVLAVGAVWSGKQVLTKYNTKMDSVVASYADEMVYHDGDFEEMQMCHNDYLKRLVTLGPQKKSKMLNSYLEVYAKKKPVSPQAISSLSHVFSMYKLSEENAAKALVEVGKECMKDKLASAGKLLFFGERILNSPGGQLALQPIRDMLADSYRAGGKQIVATSQKTMGEAAYRACVAAGGKEQETLTVGWEVLGLTKEKAQEIFDEVAETGFKSKREMQYAGTRQKYDAKGRKVDADGKLVDPTEEDDDEDDSSGGGGGAPSGSVYECTECGYTLFPAAGREFKFFPDSFKCPECGAPKDKFVDRSKK